MNFYIAAAFELGIPIALALVAALRPSTRKWCVVVLGALTPLLLTLIVTSVQHLVFAQEEAGFIFYELWLTSLFPYVACLVFGSVIGFLKVPQGLAMRYIVGFVPPSVVAVLLAVFMPQ